MMFVRSDSELVAAFTDGNAHAFAEIYDRHAARVHDYCWSMLRSNADAQDAAQDTMVIASQRMAQLRDPTRLRPWLLAIARNECRRRGRQRQRTIPMDEPRGPTGELAVEDDPTAPLVETSSAQLVWDAAASLPERDQELLNLHLRQGLQGEELAQAVGLPLDQLYVALGRLRERVGTSLGALLVARQGRRDCSELGELLADWDGTFSSVWRKRIARHVDDCVTCSKSRSRFLDPGELLAHAAERPLPAGMRAAVLSTIATPAASALWPRFGWDASGFPLPFARKRPRIGLWLTAAGAALLALLVAVQVVGSGDNANTDVRARAASTSSSPSSTASTPLRSTSATTSANPLAGLPPGLDLRPPAPVPATTSASSSATTASAPNSTSTPTTRATPSTRASSRSTVASSLSTTNLATASTSQATETSEPTTQSTSVPTTAATTASTIRLSPPWIKLSTSATELVASPCVIRGSTRIANITVDVGGGQAPYDVSADSVALSGGPTHFTATAGPYAEAQTVTVLVTVVDGAGQRATESVTLNVVCDQPSIG